MYSCNKAEPSTSVSRPIYEAHTYCILKRMSQTPAGYRIEQDNHMPSINAALNCVVFIEILIYCCSRSHYVNTLHGTFVAVCPTRKLTLHSSWISSLKSCSPTSDKQHFQSVVIFPSISELIRFLSVNKTVISFVFRIRRRELREWEAATKKLWKKTGKNKLPWDLNDGCCSLN